MPTLQAADRRRIQKLSALLEEVRQTRRALSITRLRVVEKLCEPPEAAQAFAWFLVHCALTGFDADPPKGLEEQARARHRRLMEEARDLMKAADGSPPSLAALREHHSRLRAEQNEHKNIPYGAVRLINDSWLLLVEDALSCFMGARPGSSYWAYHAARTFAEAYDPYCGTGLIPASAPALEQIVEFWRAFYGLGDAPGRLAWIEV